MLAWSRLWILALALPAGCHGGRPATPAMPDVPRKTTSANARLRLALRQVLDGSRARDDVRVDVECRTGDGYRAAVLFGGGVGIWQGQHQFQLSTPDLDRALRAFERHRFFALAEVYGEGGRPDESLITLTCSVTLGIDREVKRVAQLDRGPESTELRQLAREVLAICEGPGSSGLEITGLADGLRQVAGGSLAPEVLTISAHYQPAEPGLEGWLLRLVGRRLTSETYRANEGYGSPMALVLPGADVAGLAAILSDSAVTDLSGNLPLPGYTDLTVSVLGQSKEIQARPFAGRQTAPADALRFERIREALANLHTRAQREGRRDAS